MNRQLHPLDVTFDEIKDLQCPNCNGYRVKDNSGEPLSLALNMLLTISTFGLWLIIWILGIIIKALFSQPKKDKDVMCKLCGYRWTYQIPREN